MTPRPPVRHIVDRARKLVHLKEPLEALQVEQSTKYDLTAGVHLGEFWVHIGSGKRLTIMLGPAVPVLWAEGEEITVLEEYEDYLYRRVLPALEQELVLDELADI